MSDARRRALLSALGIGQWVPRAVRTVTAKQSATGTTAAEQLWRQGNDDFYRAATADQARQPGTSADLLDQPSTLTANVADQPLNHVQESGLQESVFTENASTANDSAANASTINFSTTNLNTTNGSADNTNTAVIQTAIAPANDNQPAQPAFNINPHVSELLPNTSAGQSDVANLEAEHTSLLMGEAISPAINFRLQACEINQWIVLVNEEDLQDASMQALWQNILRAFHQPAITYFSWPLSEGQRWQRSTGAKSALNGFLFRMGLDKRVGLMSELADDVCPDRLERLPHLAELLAEPLKKRTLWHLLKVQ